MTDDSNSSRHKAARGSEVVDLGLDDTTGSLGGGALPPIGKPKIKKLRLLLILFGLSILAIISTIFGMMMAVASDLPALENRDDFKHAKNSVLLDVRGRPIGVLTGNQNRILIKGEQISPAMKHAIISIEDRRFYENNGVDFKGIARAVVQDVRSKKGVQGASTISQQFVKNAMAAQNNRTVFQKLRESALAYHLNRKWTKDKILTEYLNAIYFGNGAYGIESAARVYFGTAHPGCGENENNPCASQLLPYEAALIAGVVASPSGYDPVTNPVAAKQRRDIVLEKMLQEGYINSYEYQQGTKEAIPSANDIQPPREKSASPYFTSWMKQQVVEKFGARRSFAGGLKIKTTLDLDLQQAAEQAVAGRLSGIGPSASLVAIDNRTGEVRAMVGGNDFKTRPFNLATQGQRQPGSSFKPFVLAAALKSGISPNSTWESRKKEFTVPNTGGKEKFVVNNYEGNYAGVSNLVSATVQSDNSVYAEVGIKVGVKKIAKLAQKMGIRTPVSHNYAITLGGLKQGVTALDMAHAYQTFARNGKQITGTLGAPKRGPVAIREVRDPKGHLVAKNEEDAKQVIPEGVAKQTTAIMQQVVSSGTAKRAAIGGFAAGKTGTTEDYGDAWFVGFNERYTVAVWVGYADSVQSMKTEYNGEPVAGGTFPAEIWHDFMLAAKQINKQRAAENSNKDDETTTETEPTQQDEPQENTQPEEQQPSQQPRETTPAKKQPRQDPQPDPEPTPQKETTPATSEPTGSPEPGDTSGGANAPAN